MSLIPSFTCVRRAGSVALGAATAAAIMWSPVAHADAGSNVVADLVDRTAPAVVTILSTPDHRKGGKSMNDLPFGGFSPFEEFFRQFGFPGGKMIPRMPDRGENAVSLGSGFLIDADGYVVTNNHVVDDARKVTVRLADEREFKAEVIGTDPQSDLALLKVDGTDLPHLTLGDSDKLRVGDDVLAVGNPFGLGGTVTRGIVSALARDINAGPYVDFIQTDAAINRGNSGGPLLNFDGDVVGVNSQIYSPTGGSVGVGFAIPSNTVAAVVKQLREHGSVERGWLGVSIQSLSPEIVAAMDLGGATGALVAEVVKGSPADGKLDSGDVITEFNGVAVQSSRDLPKLVAGERPGSDVRITVIRDGREETVSLTLGKLDPERLASARTTLGGDASSDRLGATIAPLDRERRAALGIGDDVEGVIITDLDSDGRAARAGLQVGDVVLEIAGKPVRTAADVAKALSEAPADAVLVRIARGDARIFVGVSLV